MYCRKCGNQIPDVSEFCPYCGEKVVVASDAQKSEETKNEMQSNSKSVFQKFKQSMWGEILIVLLFGIIGIAGILVLYMIGNALLEAGYVGIVMAALFLFCDGTFAWLTYDYAKKERYGKAAYTGILLFIVVIGEIYLASSMF